MKIIIQNIKNNLEIKITRRWREFEKKRVVERSLKHKNEALFIEK